LVLVAKFAMLVTCRAGWPKLRAWGSLAQSFPQVATIRKRV
jgi:hypothetical protein